MNLLTPKHRHLYPTRWGIPFEVWLPIIYALIAALWIYYSDMAVTLVARTPERIRLFSIYKGWSFVAFTAVLLYVLLRGTLARMRQTQQELRESGEDLHKKERTMSLILDSISELFLYQTPDHKILWANRAAGESVKMSPEDLKGRYCYTLWGQQDHECEYCPFPLVRETGMPYEREITSPDGRHWDIHGYPINGPDGKVETLVEVVLDISDRKRAEIARLESEARFRAVVEQAADGIFLIDPRGRVIDANNQACLSLGYSRDELLRLTVADLDPKMQPDGMVSALNRLTPGETLIRETDHRRKDGSTFPVELRIGRVELGDHYLVLSLARDITDRKQAVEQLRTLNETLEQRVAERAALAEQRATQLRALALQLTQAEQKERRRVAHILHEHFQQLLVAARFHVDHLQRHPNLPADIALEKIKEAIGEAIRTSRSLTVELSPPILYDVGLGHALEWLGRWMHERHGLRVEVLVEPDAEPAEEDLRVMLFHATRELLLNVVKHAGVSAACLEMTCRQDQIRIVVADEGKGFDPASRPEQHDPNAGYGLFSIRERLRQIGGRLEIDTAPARGTRVCITAPAHQQLEPTT